MRIAIPSLAISVPYQIDLETLQLHNVDYNESPNNDQIIIANQTIDLENEIIEIILDIFYSYSNFKIKLLRIDNNNYALENN